MNWRTRQRNEMAADMVKNRRKTWILRDGKPVHVVPTLKEARQAAEDIQKVLDIANGDAPATPAVRRAFNKVLESIAK